MATNKLPGEDVYRDGIVWLTTYKLCKRNYGNVEYAHTNKSSDFSGTKNKENR